MKANPSKKSTFISFSLLVMALTTLFNSAPAAPVGTAFTYQGRLVDNGSPATGIYDLRFAIYDSLSTGTQQGNSLTNSATSVSNGQFTVVLDFGNQFPGADRWLDVAVRTNGAGAFSPLSPRQKLTSTPYAVTAGNVVSGGLVAGTYGNAVTFDNSANSFSGNGAGLANVNAATLNGYGYCALPCYWNLTGNTGTTPATQYLGTSDNNPLTIKVNNVTALRIEPATFGPNVIGGLAALIPTQVRAGVRGAVVAGGGAPAGPVSGLGGGDFFAVYDSDCAIGGGFGNKVGTDNGNVEDSPFATVAGGVFNSAANYASTVAGGDGNYAAGSRAAIGGGYGNQAFSAASVIAGGQVNVVQTNSPSATISGGQNNSISPGGIGYVSAKGATIGGGEGNTVFGLGGFPEGPLYNEYGTIGGGYSNTVNASYGTVPGGYFNTASGDFSFAAGSRAKAVNYGSFVWADSQSADFSSTANNQVSFRCLGGARFTSGAGGANQTVSWTPGSASWSFSSDRALKEGFEAVDGLAVLEKVAQLPISEWNYKGYPQRHIGTMAQDFHAAFPLNESTTTLNDADLHGVALAAIQGLNEKVEIGSQKSENRIQRLEAENAGLKQTVNELKVLVQAMNRKLNEGAK